MASDNQQTSQQMLPFALKSDSQGMELYLDRVLQVDLGDLQPPTVLKLLEHRKYAINDEVIAKVRQAVASWHEAPQVRSSVLLAEGRAPQPGKSGSLEWTPKCDPARHVPDESDNDFSHYSSHIISVDVDEVIANVIAPTKGKPGVDVYGVEIPARDGKEYIPKLRGGCHYDEKLRQVIADVRGPLVLEGESIGVRDALHIEGNVDFNTGHVDAPGDVVIDGYVADMFHVISRKNITIAEDVMSADIIAGGDISVGGSLVNHRKGICQAGGDVFLRLADNSIVVARGSLHLERESSNSDLFIARDVRADNAHITSGTIAARGGMVVKSLGSPSGSQMIVMAGVDWIYHAIADPLVAAAEDIDQQLEKRLPALNALRLNLKRLTAAQREQATELECEAQMMELERDEDMQRVEALKQAGQDDCKTSVQVLQQIYPGVELRLANRVTKIKNPIRGPITFTLETTSTGLSIVYRGASGVAMSLKTGRMENPLLNVELPPISALEAMEKAVAGEAAKTPTQ